VFRAMFNHKNTKEFRENRIEISDSTAPVVHKMLIYLYTGTLADEIYAIELDAVPLMKIADKYQIHSLMEFNEEKLIERFAKCKIFISTINLHFQPFIGKCV
jgi:hypothetical protein